MTLPEASGPGPSLESRIIARIQREGPVTFRQFMEWALYDSEGGYYTRTARRSGRLGDFITSVDVGPLFGDLLHIQFVEFWRLLDSPTPFHLVEAAAGNGQLAADILDAARLHHPDFYHAIHLTLLERSVKAAEQQATLLSHHPGRWSVASSLPPQITGAIFANELLDALPFHRVRQTARGLREIFVASDGQRLIEEEGPLSSPELKTYVQRACVQFETGWEAEINLAAVDWTVTAARALSRGFLTVIDYGHEARELFSDRHPFGTARAFRAHRLQDSLIGAPGDQDLTADVDFTAVREAGVAAGLDVLEMVDQTYFLLGMGAADRLSREASTSAVKQRLALKTLLVPGGLGSTHKVLIFGKNIGRPALRAGSFARRIT